MKLFKYPFSKRTALAVMSPTEGVCFAQSSLSIVHNPGVGRTYSFRDKLIHAKNFMLRGDCFDFGVVSRRLVTTDGVTYMASAFAAGPGVSLMKYHGVGLGTGAESVADAAATFTSLQGSNGSSTGVTGSQAHGLSSANATYTTVATVLFNAGLAITEHGIFASSTLDEFAALLDRSKFAAINVVSGDSITITYVLTLNSGG